MAGDFQIRFKNSRAKKTRTYGSGLYEGGNLRVPRFGFYSFIIRSKAAAQKIPVANEKARRLSLNLVEIFISFRFAVWQLAGYHPQCSRKEHYDCGEVFEDHFCGFHFDFDF